MESKNIKNKIIKDCKNNFSDLKLLKNIKDAIFYQFWNGLYDIDFFCSSKDKNIFTSHCYRKIDKDNNDKHIILTWNEEIILNLSEKFFKVISDENNLKKEIKKDNFSNMILLIEKILWKENIIDLNKWEYEVMEWYTDYEIFWNIIIKIHQVDEKYWIIRVYDKKTKFIIFEMHLWLFIFFFAEELLNYIKNKFGN